jgi:hypothetical protein
LPSDEFGEKADRLGWICFERCNRVLISTIPFGDGGSSKEDEQSRANATAMKLNRLSSPQAK